MPPANFHPLTRAEFAEVLRKFPFARRVDAVHMHHTWSPDHADYLRDGGLGTIEGMWRFHTQVRKWSDIAQHVSIAPDGTIWTGRNWNSSPASAVGYNGSSAVGPFMFETIGNFDIGHDRLEGEQLESVLTVITLVQQRFSLAPETLHFHREMTDQKSCPGTGLKREDILKLAKAHAAARAMLVADASSARRRSPSGRAATVKAKQSSDIVDALIARGIERGVVDENGELDEDRGPRGEPQDDTTGQTGVRGNLRKGRKGP